MTPKVAPIRAAIYARFSHAEGDSDSVDVQTRQAKKALEANGWMLNEAYVLEDDGFSGREMLRRPGLRRLLEAAARGEFDVIVLRDLDRFSRSEPSRVLGELQKLADKGVQLWSYLKKAFVRIDEEHALMTAFATYGNRQEAVKASGRIRDKLLDREEEGGFTSCAPYGFLNRRRKPDGTIGEFPHKGTFSVVVRHPEQFPVLPLIADLFLRLGTYNAVAAELNRRKIPSPAGRHWAAKSVTNILANPAYRGKLVRGRTVSCEQGGTLSRTDAPEQNVRVYDHPELRPDWDEVTLACIDAQMAARSRVTTWGPGRKHLSSSFVKCGLCGSSVSITSSSRSTSKAYCCTKARSKACEGIGYRAEHAVDAAVRAACASVLTDKILARVSDTIRETFDVRRRIETEEIERARLTRAIATAERHIKSTHELALDSEGVERDHHRVSLRDQLARLKDLQMAAAKAEASPAPTNWVGHSAPTVSAKPFYVSFEGSARSCRPEALCNPFSPNRSSRSWFPKSGSCVNRTRPLNDS